MKTFIFFVVLILASTLVDQAAAQTNWVVCENPINGARQSFPNQCPAGWIFISH